LQNVTIVVLFFVIASVLLGSLNQDAFAANYNEMEAEFDAAANNELANAESIAPALFTAPEPAGVMPRQGSVTATILGQAGQSVFTVSQVSHTPGEKASVQNNHENSDIDFYSFILLGPGNKIFMADVDDATDNGFDSQLHLFDANGFPVAFNDDSMEIFLDPMGIPECCDSFIGEISLPPGTYFIAINAFSGEAVVGFGNCSPTSFLTRPDGEPGGQKCDEPPGAADPSFPDSEDNPGGGDDYTLHLSLKMPAVGGIFEGVNTISLLLNYFIINAIWMAPIGIGIGVGIYLVKRRF